MSYYSIPHVNRFGRLFFFYLFTQINSSSSRMGQNTNSSWSSRAFSVESPLNSSPHKQWKQKARTSPVTTFCTSIVFLRSYCGLSSSHPFWHDNFQTAYLSKSPIYLVVIRFNIFPSKQVIQKIVISVVTPLDSMIIPDSNFLTVYSVAPRMSYCIRIVIQVGFAKDFDNTLVRDVKGALAMRGNVGCWFDVHTLVYPYIYSWGDYLVANSRILSINQPPTRPTSTRIRVMIKFGCGEG